MIITHLLKNKHLNERRNCNAERFSHTILKYKEHPLNKKMTDKRSHYYKINCGPYYLVCNAELILSFQRIW